MSKQDELKSYQTVDRLESIVQNAMATLKGRNVRIIHPFRILFTVSLLLCCSLDPREAVGEDPERPWNAYWLTGGANAANGYQWLLICRQKLEKLAVSEESAALVTPKTSPPILDAPAFWIETHEKSAVWNSSGQPITVPPRIKNYRPDEQKVEVGDVEYRVESAPMKVAIQLLKEPNGRGILHRRFPPFLGLENTAKALVALLDAETAAAASAPTKLSVGGSFGGVRSVITSKIAEPDPRSNTLHGPQVVLGPEMRLRELAVYDNGFLERRETYIEDGFKLIHEEFSRESLPGGHGGNGYRLVWSKGIGTTGAPSAALAEGYLLDGKPWHGAFVFVEGVPGNQSFEYPVRLVLREYSEGKVTATKTDITLGFGDREKEQDWLKNLPAVLKDH